MASGRAFTMLSASAPAVLVLVLLVLVLVLVLQVRQERSIRSEVGPRPVPPGYKLYESLGYYKLHYEWKNWFDAKAACEAEGGYLAVLNSQEEADFAGSLLSQYKVPGAVWTGVSDVNLEQTWITSLRDPLSATGYEVWAPGHPNEPGRANCLALVPGKGLDDLYCDATSRPFLCELLD